MIEPAPYGESHDGYALQPGRPDRKPDRLEPGPTRLALEYDNDNFIEIDPATGEIVAAGAIEWPEKVREKVREQGCAA